MISETHIIFIYLISPDSGYASTSIPSMEEINQYLIEQGLPQENVSQISDEDKINLYRDGARLVAIDTEYGNLNETQTTGKLPIKEHPISPLATLKNWTGTLSIWEVASGRKDILKHRVFYQWTWNQRANFNLTDKFGVAWSDDWDALPETSKYSYTVRGVNNTGANNSRTFNYTGYSDYKPGNGIGWSVNILHNFNIGSVYHETNRHQGYGTVDIVKGHNRSGRQDSSSAVGQYFHKRGAVTGSINFNGSSKPGISISWATQYDTSPVSPRQWYWHHRDY